MDELMGPVRRRLLAQAYLFDDPGAYEAGVEDALAAIVQVDEASLVLNG